MMIIMTTRRRNIMSQYFHTLSLWLTVLTLWVVVTSLWVVLSRPSSMSSSKSLWAEASVWMFPAKCFWRIITSCRASRPKLKNRVNMKNLREEIKTMSVNQISVYHTLLEAYNVMRHLSSEKIYMKWKITERKYALKSTYYKK